MLFSKIFAPQRELFQWLRKVTDEVGGKAVMLRGARFESGELNGPGCHGSAVEVVNMGVDGSEVPIELYLSKEPGVTVGVSPTLKALDLRTFLSKYFLAKALSCLPYSFSMVLLSR